MKKAIALVLLIIVVSLYSLGKTAPIDERDKWMRDTLELGDSIMATYSSTLDYSPYGQYIAGYITLVGDDSVGTDLDTFKVYNVNYYNDTVLCGLINELGYIDTMAILSSGQESKFLINDSYLWNVNIIRTNTTNLAARTSYGLLEFSNTAGTWAVQTSGMDSIGAIATVTTVGTVTTVTTVGTVSTITNGHIFTSDTTQKKYRASYTLTSTGADTIFQDTAYGNFRDIYIGYADTGVTTSAGITDSCIVELYDALLSVWKPVGVINMWNGNHYLYVSPGSGLNAEYKIDHYIVDIFRIRFVNTQVGLGTRTGTVSWSGKADR